jgi:hypothetical protein
VVGGLFRSHPVLFGTKNCTTANTWFEKGENCTRAQLLNDILSLGELSTSCPLKPETDTAYKGCPGTQLPL